MARHGRQSAEAIRVRHGRLSTLAFCVNNLWPAMGGSQPRLYRVRHGRLPTLAFYEKYLGHSRRPLCRPRSVHQYRLPGRRPGSVSVTEARPKPAHRTPWSVGCLPVSPQPTVRPYQGSFSLPTATNSLLLKEQDKKAGCVECACVMFHKIIF